MKTNANSNTIIKAVQNVSNEKYDGNVVFMNKPKDITKYVRRFTLRTKDVNGMGSMVTKAGQRQPKANWQVQQDVMDEILKLNPDPSIYVDTIYGRKFSTGEITIESPAPSKKEVHMELEPVLVEADEHRIKRAYNKKPKAVDQQKTIIKALKHLIKHPELLVA